MYLIALTMLHQQIEAYQLLIQTSIPRAVAFGPFLMFLFFVLEFSLMVFLWPIIKSFDGETLTLSLNLLCITQSPDILMAGS